MRGPSVVSPIPSAVAPWHSRRVHTADISDVVDSVLARWIARCVAWTPARALPITVARSSAMATALDLGAWPEDLMAPLYTAFDGVVGQVRDSLDEEDADGIPHEYWVSGHDHAAAALREVRVAVLARRHEILDLLLVCVAPRYPERSPLYP